VKEKNLAGKVQQGLRVFFPEEEIYARSWPWQHQVMGFAFLFALFCILGYFIPANGFVAFDWVHFFSRGHIPPFYPPWDAWAVRWLTWPVFFGLSMAAISISIIKRSRHAVSGIAASLTLPVFWAMFLGQLEGLVVLGLLGLPWLTPLALLKPQVSLFAFGARRNYVLAALLWVSISLILWPGWPLRMLATNHYYAEGRYPQDISLGLRGALLAVPMMWFSRGDMDMLMVSGAFMTLHLLPYNMLPFVPAVARLKPEVAVVLAALSWLPLLSNWMGKEGWWLGWIFAAGLWGALAQQRYFQVRVSEAKAPRPTVNKHP